MLIQATVYQVPQESHEMTIINNYKHWHIHNSIKVALGLFFLYKVCIFVPTRFEDVNHTEVLFSVMKNHPCKIQCARVGLKRLIIPHQIFQWKDVWILNFE